MKTILAAVGLFAALASPALAQQEDASRIMGYGVIEQIGPNASRVMGYGIIEWNQPALSRVMGYAIIEQVTATPRSRGLIIQ